MRIFVPYLLAFFVAVPFLAARGQSSSIDSVLAGHRVVFLGEFHFQKQNSAMRERIIRAMLATRDTLVILEEDGYDFELVYNQKVRPRPGFTDNEFDNNVERDYVALLRELGQTKTIIQRGVDIGSSCFAELGLMYFFLNRHRPLLPGPFTHFMAQHPLGQIEEDYWRDREHLNTPPADSLFALCEEYRPHLFRYLGADTVHYLRLYENHAIYARFDSLWATSPEAAFMMREEVLYTRFKRVQQEFPTADVFFMIGGAHTLAPRDSFLLLDADVVAHNWNNIVQRLHNDGTDLLVGRVIYPPKRVPYEVQAADDFNPQLSRYVDELYDYRWDAKGSRFRFFDIRHDSTLIQRDCDFLMLER